MNVSRMRGMTLVDVLVGTALMLIFFLALFGILRASLTLTTLAQAKAGATAVAETNMEYLRSLAYDSLGTVGGIPAGLVLQDATTTEDGIPYTVHTFISYVDDPADGLGASDTNGITTDYKRARVAVSYSIAGRTNATVLVSNFAPPGIETTNGGGTLAINVVDAAGAPVADASVNIMNAATSPTINVTTMSNLAGVVYLPGAATSSSYQVVVSRSGYSSAQTYARDNTNQNPNPGYLTVVKNQTTTGTFAIDQLALMNLATFSPIATSTFSDAFTNGSKLSDTSSTTASGGSLTLIPGATAGEARSVATSSPLLVRWGQAIATTSTPTGTSALIHIYDAAGALIPDTALAGNAAGFSSFPVSLYGLSTTTYPSLSIGTEFTSTGSSSPSVTGWSLSYTAGPTPLPNVSFTLTGAKTIGSKGDGTPIYKTTLTSSTGNEGTQALSLEWDSYSLLIPSYDITDACASPPYALAPGTNVSDYLILGSPTTNYLRVLVADNSGVPVPGATVTLSRAGYSSTVSSSSCGSSYFGGLTAASDYTVSIAKTGYTTTSFTAVPVAGQSTFGATFP